MFLLSSDDLLTVHVLISGSVNPSKPVVRRPLGDRVLWTQRCELSWRSVATHSVLVGQQMQSGDSDRGLRTQEEAGEAGYGRTVAPCSLQCAETLCFVFQGVSLWLELTWRWTWNTSAHTRKSPWRTWWCPPTPCCWAGSRSRPREPESAPSTSSLGTLSQRDTLHRP